mmetsp:Transcript_19735/g.49461  ORF Transcript_19735/g.49461 Transcript_19735/m.49461 type:complete len:268 (+) Transcript_19735:256-1059(+)
MAMRGGHCASVLVELVAHQLNLAHHRLVDPHAIPPLLVHIGVRVEDSLVEGISPSSAHIAHHIPPVGCPLVPLTHLQHGAQAARSFGRLLEHALGCKRGPLHDGLQHRKDARVAALRLLAQLAPEEVGERLVQHVAHGHAAQALLQRPRAIHGHTHQQFELLAVLGSLALALAIGVTLVGATASAGRRRILPVRLVLVVVVVEHPPSRHILPAEVRLVQVENVVLVDDRPSSRAQLLYERHGTPLDTLRGGAHLVRRTVPRHALHGR